MDNNKNTQLFVSLIYTFQMQTLVSLGKLKNPMTEETEKDLTAAQTTIDMIEMLKEKTKNNLNEQLNFVAEQTKAGEKESKPESEKEDEKSDTDKKEEDSSGTKEKNSENKQEEKKESPPQEGKKEDK